MIMNLPSGYLIPVILLKIASCNEIMIPLHERVIVGSRNTASGSQWFSNANFTRSAGHLPLTVRKSNAFLLA